MEQITAKPNQSMMDIVIQALGSLEAGMQFCLDNGVSITDIPAVGTVYTISDAAIAIGDTFKLQYLQKNQVTVGTLGAPPPCPAPTVDAIAGDGTLYAGDTLTLTNTTPGGVWSSSDPGIATIDATGLVTGLANGAVTIYYTVTAVCGTETAMPHGIVVNTAPALSLSILLKPVMEASYIGATDPNILGYYPIELNSGTGFININSLSTAYPGAQNANYEGQAGMHGGTPPGTVSELGGAPATAKHLEYHIPWPMALGNIWVWGAPGIWSTFDDIAGNRAISAPVVVLNDHTAGITENLIAKLDITMVSQVGSRVTLRLRRNHPATAHINYHPPFGHITMNWVLPSGAVLYSDPGDPGNPDNQFADLHAGTYLFGVRSSYTNDVTGDTWPAESECTQVILIS
jgi:hypothetical protein